MKPIFSVYQAENGFIATVKGEPDAVYVLEDKGEVEGSDVDTFVALLWLLTEFAGPSTSRYSQKRVVIRAEPGDKYEPSSEGKYSPGWE